MLLDDFKFDQPIVYKMLINSVVKKRFSHAYLFEANGYEKKEELALAFAKYLICPEHHTSKDSAKDCNYCQRIEDGNFIEIKIIEPDGMWIKKEQLIDLQKEFSKKAIEGNKKIYIINKADRLNASSANSILKFLEEPEENIIAILVCDNSYNVLDTIKSRCQTIPFMEVKENKSLSFWKNEDEKKILQIAINFVNYFEQNKLDTMLYFEKQYGSNLENRDSYLKFLNFITLYYKDVLNYLLNKEIELFQNNNDSIIKMADKNTIEEVCNKIYFLIDMEDRIKGNSNINLTMDKLIILLERGK
jgi:DNA polymerase-3 subunit delta'